MANMSHEIRTPINAVLGMDEMILRESFDSKILEYASDIKQAGSMLLSLINDILDFSKIESGKMDIIPVDYDLGVLLSDTIDMIRSRAEEKKLQLELNIEPDTPVHLHGDEVRIRQIMTNILTNAVKYTPEGKVILTVSAKNVSAGTVQLYVSVKVPVLDFLLPCAC
ncbi:MAG: histidine kinase dimerization/phospho-acceptor domain-containing protein [Thermoflexaceae bacterium]|nr:histidine kinase dimerization/phospho-acceptor domain-containing protein [Thermoflexaceae bacterium]